MTRASEDRVMALWTGTGTGTMSLGGAVPGEAARAFPASLDGQYIRYLITHETAIEAEAGVGLYTHSGATLSRLYRTYPTAWWRGCGFQFWQQVRKPHYC